MAAVPRRARLQRAYKTEPMRREKASVFSLGKARLKGDRITIFKRS